MELRAVTEGLKVLPKRCAVIVRSDSQYVQRGITAWISRWKSNGWRTSYGQPVLNKDLWRELDKLDASCAPEWRWIKGHADDWKLDRFGRSLRHLVNALADLESLDVSFISLKDNLDGRLMFQIIGAMAEFERALTQERVKAGLRNARAKGKRLGRPRVAVDYSQVARLRESGLPGRR